MAKITEFRIVGNGKRYKIQQFHKGLLLSYWEPRRTITGPFSCYEKEFVTLDDCRKAVDLARTSGKRFDYDLPPEWKPVDR